MVLSFKGGVIMAMVSTNRFIGVCPDDEAAEFTNQCNNMIDFLLELRNLYKKYNVLSIENGKIYLDDTDSKLNCYGVNFKFR